MIVSDQITREQALKALEEPLYDEKLMDEYIALLKTRMGICDAEFEEIMAAPAHQHTEYAVEQESLLLLAIRQVRAFGKKIVRKSAAHKS